MRADLVPGATFPDLQLPDHIGTERTLSGIAAKQPLVLAFVRGWWCPKEVVRLRNLVAMQEEIEVEYGRVAAITVDPPQVNGALRVGLGATFPFLSDEDRRVGEELDLLELTDTRHRPHLPYTFLLDSALSIRRIWLGYWFWGNPHPDELRAGLREVNRSEQPTFDAQRVWATGGAGSPASGIAGEVVWIHEDAGGREISRGVHIGIVPARGDAVGADRYGRPWLVHEVESENGTTALHLRREPVT